MAYVMVRHKVGDFGRWKAMFDGAVEMRKNGGEKSSRIFQAADDDGHIVGLFEWDSVDRAREFFGGAELKDAMQKAGVSGAPDILFLNEAR